MTLVGCVCWKNVPIALAIGPNSWKAQLQMHWLVSKYNFQSVSHSTV